MENIVIYHWCLELSSIFLICLFAGFRRWTWQRWTEKPGNNVEEFASFFTVFGWHDWGNCRTDQEADFVDFFRHIPSYSTDLQQKTYPPGNWHAPLKTNGWKMKFPFKMVLWTFDHFQRGYFGTQDIHLGMGNDIRNSQGLRHDHQLQLYVLWNQNTRGMYVSLRVMGERQSFSAQRSLEFPSLVQWDPRKKRGDAYVAIYHLELARILEDFQPAMFVVSKIKGTYWVFFHA